MNLIDIRINGDQVCVGSRCRKMITSNGCNEPFKGRFWCPRRQWFMASACPFADKYECAAFRQMCGRI